MEAMFLLNMLIGDSVILWRVFAVYQHVKKVLILPLIFLLASLAFAIISVACLVQGTQTFKSAISEGSKACQWGEPTAWALSLVTNTISTSLIAYKAWQHRRVVKAGLGSRGSKSKVEKVLALLVESSLIYILFWITELTIFDIPESSPNIYAYLFFASLGDQISGLYPTLIILLVHYSHTMQDATTNSTPFTLLTQTPIASSSMRFAGRILIGSSRRVAGNAGIVMENGTEEGYKLRRREK